MAGGWRAGGRVLGRGSRRSLCASQPSAPPLSRHTTRARPNVPPRHHPPRTRLWSATASSSASCPRSSRPRPTPCSLFPPSTASSTATRLCTGAGGRGRGGARTERQQQEHLQLQHQLGRTVGGELGQVARGEGACSELLTRPSALSLPPLPPAQGLLRHQRGGGHAQGAGGAGAAQRRSDGVCGD